ncbi:MAG: SPOR domain-containing protein [Gemmatimonadota bacterium]
MKPIPGRWAGWLFLLLPAGPPRLLAQTPPAAAELAGVEAAADAGRVAEARRALARWFADRSEHAGRKTLARARFLRARLNPDADSARTEYLWVAIEGSSDYGAAAWLRLGQLDLLSGQVERALQDLERLRADYPRVALVPASWLWTGLALETRGQLEQACEAWERAREAAGAFGAAGVAEQAKQAAVPCGREELRFTVQLGAFRSRQAAEQMRARAADAGFPARIERVRGLHKVRVGVYGSAESAREAAARIRAAGLSAAIIAAGS